ncbi:MAG: hypothetical protein K2W82_06220 [Candidatus Obscuribacterales bacterium]|nr:hypothetical protein [Candidatus Obscuribacterales bacterium]
MVNTLITKLDLEPVLASHTGNRIFAQALQAAANGDDLLWLFGQYSHFNSVFGAGVATLAGEIARRQELFQDKNEKAQILAEQSIEVASQIFYAAVDEFACNHTHRSMAKKSLKETAAFYKLTDDKLNDLMPVTVLTRTFMDRVTEGYCPDRQSSESKVHQAIGFHLASEIVSDEEFNVLDRHMKTALPELTEHLRKNKAYTWIQVHTTVEAEHFDSALAGANSSFAYYSGTLSLERVKELILIGFAEYACLQTEFMNCLLESLTTPNRGPYNLSAKALTH